MAAAACDRAPEPTFVSRDLPAIVLHADEAPAGTRYDASEGGPSDLDSFARNPEEREALVDDGFRSGYVVFFPPESFFRDRPHAVTDVSFQAIAGLFDDGDGASSALGRYVDDLRTRQMVQPAEISSGGLGDEGFGLAGAAASDGSFLRVYAWRHSNLVLVLVASGPVAADDAIGLARAMDARAAAAHVSGTVRASG